MLCIALSVLVLGAALPVRSQSLEEIYANPCVDTSAKQGETCAALRKAMLDKLNAEEGCALPAGAARTPGTASARYAFRIEPDSILFRYEFLSENQWQDWPWVPSS